MIPRTVWTEDPHARKLGLLRKNLVFQGATFGTDLTETGRYYDNAPCACFAQSANQAGDRRRRCADNGKIRSVGKALDVLVRLDSLNGFTFGIHGIYDTAKSRPHKVSQNRVPNACRRVARANHSNTMGIKILFRF